MTYHIETLSLHAGQTSDPATQSANAPIYRTTAYQFKNSKQGADLFALRELGNIYSRLTNPTNDLLEKRIAAIEGGKVALTVSSGTAAIYFAITNILKNGDELVSANNLYGGTFTQFDAILPQQGINVKFTKVNDFEAVEKAINEKTKAIYIETIGNPELEIADIEGYSKIAKKYKLPLIVDSTFTPSPLLRPIEHGADIVIHSLSKWMGGHGNGIGGVIVDAGNFDWSDPKFTLFNEPDRGYHGLRFAHDLGALTPIAFTIRLRTVGLRNQGPTLAPDAAWLFLQGIETLPLRMKQHCSNALIVAKFLKNHRNVAWVRYPGLPDDSSNPLAQKYLKNGFGGVVTFGIKGNSKDAVFVADNIDIFTIQANVGDAKSLIIHPASTTHSQLTDEAQIASGIKPEALRLSIGLEHPDDLTTALDEVLNKI